MAIIERLLEDSSIDVNLKDVEGASLLHRAPYGKPECGSIVTKLLEKGAKVLVANSKNQSPLQLACRAGDVESVRALLTYGANILHMDNKGLNALHYAARSGNLETLLCVLEASEKDSLNIAKSRDKAGRNALHHALTEYPDMELVELLVKRGVRLMAASANGCYSKEPTLLQGMSKGEHLSICLLVATETSS
ncbi:hypothetical protein HYALB_00009362 [Hymenoscyphus albidus]|uniref:Ankyrin n=1 Tax=Hymenoscyphus albidus TaxID=595503 RepID=A0A9N9Q6T2_9HELO|nr:hypothetical protein HYALB_00009362 [Hymenoscyphus albidus]